MVDHVLKAETGKFVVTGHDVGMHIAKHLNTKFLQDKVKARAPSYKAKAPGGAVKKGGSKRNVKKEVVEAPARVDITPSTYALVKHEIDLLVCTDDPKYADLRR